MKDIQLKGGKILINVLNSLSAFKSPWDAVLQVKHRVAKNCNFSRTNARENSLGQH